LNANDVLTMAVLCTYFMLVSRDWFWIYFYMTCVGSLSYLGVMLFMPESPKWLLFTGNESKAISNLNYIAKVNGSGFRLPNDGSITFLESLVYAKENLV
jgi:hypothetical protein